MSQIIAIHREDEHAIDFAWDSFVMDGLLSGRVLSWETPKVERYELPGGTEMAIGMTGSLCLIQFLSANIERLYDAIPAPTAKGIINLVAPWIRETFLEAGVFANGQVQVGESNECNMVVGLALGDQSVLTYVSNDLAVVAYENPLVCPGVCSGEVQALYQSRIEEGLRVDRAWMERALGVCKSLSPLISPPWCGCTIGGKR